MTALPPFEDLAIPHLGAAYNLAFWLIRSRPDAEDIVQDAYLRAFKAYAGFRGQDIRPWLLAIVRNVAYRWLSDRLRAGNVVSLDEALAPDAERAPFEVAAEDLNAEQELIRDAERGYVLRGLA